MNDHIFQQLAANYPAHMVWEINLRNMWAAVGRNLQGAVMTTHRNTADYFAGIPNYTTQLAAENDRLRSVIREALNFESVLPAIATVPRRILENALEEVS